MFPFVFDGRKIAFKGRETPAAVFHGRRRPRFAIASAIGSSKASDLKVDLKRSPETTRLATGILQPRMLCLPWGLLATATQAASQSMSREDSQASILRETFTAKVPTVILVISAG